jgi:hypothetical protein
VFAKNFCRYGPCSNTKILPIPPLEKGENYKELLGKSPFEKEGFDTELESKSNLWQAQASAGACTGETPVPPINGEMV